MRPPARRRLTLGLAGLALLLGSAVAGAGLVRRVEDRAVEDELRLVRTPDPDSGWWRAQVEPAELAGRVQLLVDGAPAGRGDQAELDLRGLDPGIHLVEAQLERRGGRVTRIVDHVLVGPFARRWEAPARCSLSTAVSERALADLLRPELERSVVVGLRASPLMGPGTKLERLELDLRRGSVHFQAAIAGRNRVEVEGWLVLLRQGERSLDVRLVHLGATSFEGETRDRAAGTGAAVGAALAGPLSSAGALAGSYLVNRYLDRKSRQVIRDEIQTGLGGLKSVALFPGTLELVPGTPASAVSLAFCEDPRIAGGVLEARLTLAPVVPPGRPGLSAAREGPVSLGVMLPPAQLGDDDVAVAVTVDAVNTLLDAWTAGGVLDELLEDAGLVSTTNRELAAWTTVQVSQVELALPPVVSVAPPPPPVTGDPGWVVAMAGIDLEVEAEGEGEGGARRISLAGRGVVAPHWDEATGRLVLAGRLDDLVLGCREGPEGGTQVLRPCFGALLELGDLQARVDAALDASAAGLPALALRDLIHAQAGGKVELAALGLRREEVHPGVITVGAKIELALP